MKREIVYYTILTIVIASLLFFETDMFKDEAKYISKVIDVEAFEKLDIDLDCEIFVSLGEQQKVVFEGPANYLSKVNTSMNNGVLKISCKAPGLFANLFNDNNIHEESVKIYIKLTNVDQLLKPERGNIISNEALQFMEKSSSNLFSLNADLTTILRLLGKQAGKVNL